MIKHLTKQRVHSWSELQALGKPTELGLLIPEGVYGLADTSVILDEIEEFIVEDKKLTDLLKSEQGLIISAGI